MASFVFLALIGLVLYGIATLLAGSGSNASDRTPAELDAERAGRDTMRDTLFP